MDWTLLKQTAKELAKGSPNTRSGWRCLEELTGEQEFSALLHREFLVPPEALDDKEGLRRRDFLRLIGGSLGLAGLTGLNGCTVKPHGKILPYVNQPEQIIPGRPLYYATALEFCGYGRGVVVETHEGRPTKIEGNPEHPASLGATSLFEQAAILDLYNPARSSALLRAGELAVWPQFLWELQSALANLPADGEGLHLLTGTMTSPSFGGVWEELARRYPKARWHQYEAIHRDASYAASVAGFGSPLEPRYHFDRAQTVVSFGADFLATLPGSVRYARDLMARRGGASFSRIYQLESVPTITGSYADERLAVRPNEMIHYAKALAENLDGSPSLHPVGSPAEEWAAKVATDLLTGGAALLIAGEDQPEPVHRLVQAMNQRWMKNGKTVSYSDPIALESMHHTNSLKELTMAMEGGRVQVLLMLGGDWVRTAPADFKFGEALRNVPFSVHSSLYPVETATASLWHIPQTHPFEAWSDTRAFEGTTSIVQPLIEPLFGGRSSLELLDCVARFPGRSSYEIVREHWVQSGRLGDAEWRRALHDGLIKGSEAKEVEPQSAKALPVPMRITTEGESSLVLIFTPDASLWDGRYAENPWLQELPRPITKLSWENAFLLSPATARKSQVVSGDRVRVEAAEGGESLQGIVMVQPGMAEGVIALALGGGLWPKDHEAGYAPSLKKWATGEMLGTNAYPLRTSAQPWSLPVALQKIGKGKPPITTQRNHLIEGRDLLRIGTNDELESRYPERNPPPTLYNLTETMSDGYAWAMTIDLSRCIGCNACMVACQAENNIPPVGWDQVSRGREMYWIRLDTYYFGDAENPRIAHQPVACMHCETAPCEIVCPVEATLHDHEGLNVQVYNRCIGTRYCSNNCPYKVRRFNFFRYAEKAAREPLQLMANPNVTIRARGVMEKCTYCVQRISAARIQSSVENRSIRDGEVIPACAQVCPTQTIVFGNANDPNSRLAKEKKNPLNYALLEDQSTRPRTTYLARVINPNLASSKE